MQHLGLLQPRKIKGQIFTKPTLVVPVISNAYWEMDLSYVWCENHMGYLFSVIDGYDRCIPGDCFDECCWSQEAVRALENAVLVRFGGHALVGHLLVLRVDHGTQFTSRRFREASLQSGIELEYAGIRCPDDKPYIETFFRKYKTEEVYRNDYRNIGEDQLAWESYCVWHETVRIVSVSSTKHHKICMRVLKRKSMTMKIKNVIFISLYFVQNNGVHCDNKDSKNGPL